MTDQAKGCGGSGKVLVFEHPDNVYDPCPGCEDCKPSSLRRFHENGKECDVKTGECIDLHFPPPKPKCGTCGGDGQNIAGEPCPDCTPAPPAGYIDGNAIPVGGMGHEQMKHLKYDKPTDDATKRAHEDINMAHLTCLCPCKHLHDCMGCQPHHDSINAAVKAAVQEADEAYCKETQRRAAAEVDRDHAAADMRERAAKVAFDGEGESAAGICSAIRDKIRALPLKGADNEKDS